MIRGRKCTGDEMLKSCHHHLDDEAADEDGYNTMKRKDHLCHIDIKTGNFFSYSVCVFLLVLLIYLAFLKSLVIVRGCFLLPAELKLSFTWPPLPLYLAFMASSGPEIMTLTDDVFPP